jgi:hypothetical protein
MEICVAQQLMFTADNSGCVQTWDIAAFVDHTHEPKPSQFSIAHVFRCHASAISSLQYISNRMLLVTGSSDFTVAAWSISGAAAGVFGLTDVWQHDLIAERDFVADFQRNTRSEHGGLKSTRVDAFLTQQLDESEGMFVLFAAKRDGPFFLQRSCEWCCYNFSERFEQEKMLKPLLDRISLMPFERHPQSNCGRAPLASSPRF